MSRFLKLIGEVFCYRCREGCAQLYMRQPLFTLERKDAYDLRREDAGK